MNVAYGIAPRIWNDAVTEFLERHAEYLPCPGNHDLIRSRIEEASDEDIALILIEIAYRDLEFEGLITKVLR